MAKNSMVARENKRIKLSEKYKEKRMQLKEAIRKSDDLNDKLHAQMMLQKLPKDSNKIRVTKRCKQCGRPRAVYKKFAL